MLWYLLRLKMKTDARQTLFGLYIPLMLFCSETQKTNIRTCKTTAGSEQTETGIEISG